MGRASGQDEQAAAQQRADGSSGPYDGLAATGDRLRIERSSNASLYRRNDRCTVLAVNKDGIDVVFDSGEKATLAAGDRFELIGESETAERKRACERARAMPGSRVVLESNPKTFRTRGVVRRNWRGTVTAVDEAGLVSVSFDKGPQVEIDPRIELLRNVGHEERVRAREKKTGKEKLQVGMVLELTDDVPGEKTLVKGLRGTVRAFGADGMVHMDWDGLTVNLHLDPATDPYRIYDSGTQS